MTSAIVRIGAAVSGSFDSSFKRAEKSALQLGKAYRDTNKKLAASREVISYRNQLAALEKQQRAGVKVGADAWAAARAGHAKAVAEAHKLGLELGNIDRQHARLERRAGLQRLGMGLGVVRDKAAFVGRALFGIASAGAVAGGALFALAKSTAAQGDQLAKDARMLGMQVDVLGEYRYAAERSGVSAEQLGKAFSDGGRKISEAAAGMGDAKGVIAELGLDAEFLANLRPDQQLEQIADAMAGVGNQNDKLRIAQKLWGESGIHMLKMLDGGADGMRRLRAEGRATGAILGADAARDSESFADAMTDVGAALSGVRNQIGAAMLPEFTGMMRDLTGTIIENKDGIVDFARGVGMAVRLTGKALGMAYDVIQPIGVFIGESAAKIAMGIEAISNSRIGRWISERMSDSGPAADAEASTAYAGAQAAGGSSTVNLGGVVVNAAPGMDEQALAEKVAEAIDERERSAGRRRRGAHHD